MTLAWGQFLDFYSDLNNARKESDEKYVERSFIGEEIVEPDEQAVRNDELIDRFGENDGENGDYFEEFNDNFG